MVPQDLFRKANDICMGVSDLPNAKSSGLSEKVIKDDLRLQVIKLKSTTCQAMEEGMKDYYLYGAEMGCQSGYTYNRGENMCVNNSNAEDKVEPTEVSTDFASAKKNCDVFEQALMSTRDNMYAKFEDGMVNYLSDHVAKLIKKQAKDTKTVAQAFNTLKTTDADIEISNVETEANIVTSKANAETQMTKAQTAKAKAETEKIKAQAENIKATTAAKKEMLSVYGTQMKEYCERQAQNIELNNEVFSKIKDLGVCMDSSNNLSSLIVDSNGNTSCTNSGDTKFSCISDLGMSKNIIYGYVSEKVSKDSYVSVGDIARYGKTLTPGFYKVEVAGAKGCKAGSGGNDGCSRGEGGLGAKNEAYFIVTNNTTHTYSAVEGCGNSGTFNVPGVISVGGQAGGQGGHGYRRGGAFGRKCHTGDTGASYTGNLGQNSGSAYVKLWKATLK